MRGQKWFWTFTYPNGREENNNLYLPVGKQVKFVISAVGRPPLVLRARRAREEGRRPRHVHDDGVHADVEGDTPVFCAEYCGAPLGHARRAAYFDGAPARRPLRR